MANAGSDQLVKTYHIGTRVIELYGVTEWDTPPGKYDYYDLFEDGECLNLGDPIFRVLLKREVQAYIDDIAAPERPLSRPL